jgi:two-component system phosphate regulon sensor histidine kinase PhoR
VIIEIKPQQKYLQALSSVLEGTEQPVILLLFQDLSSQRKAEQMRQDFVSNVSHELRTPLASLKALAETAERSIENDPVNARYFLSRMDVEIDKLDQMVMELLDLSKIESGRVELNKTLINVYQLLQQAADRMKMQAERAGLKISLDCPTTLPEIKVDVERVEQVLVNLIHNSVKFTPAGGLISLRAEVEGNFMVIRVQDTGAGITEDDLPRIFERFYKTDLARSTGGTGLGLSIAKHVVEAHAGKIWVKSIEGSGSTFSFSIPFDQ